ncbi:MAG: hypothetical protein RLP02_28805 [Coleofasciculus sp. C2-GNP5-27]
MQQDNPLILLSVIPFSYGCRCDTIEPTIKLNLIGYGIKDIKFEGTGCAMIYSSLNEKANIETIYS